MNEPGLFNETKVWTLEEADRAIPLVTRVFDEIFSMNDRISGLRKDMGVLYSIWGADLLNRSNPDHSYYKELSYRRAVLQKMIDTAVENMARLGCSIDDTKRGIAHFYCKGPRGLVAFCWRYGEKNITHWHELKWRADRKPVTEFEQAKA